MRLWPWRACCYGAVGRFFAFDSGRIRILSDPNLDVIYHTLAHFNLPGDRFNLFSEDYVRRMEQAKRDLEVGETRLDREAAALEQHYRQRPRLRFLIRAPFLADDLSSFRQALALIDYDFRTRTIPVGPKGRRRKEPLMFGNSRRLIPVFRNHFQARQEREFAKRFCRLPGGRALPFLHALSRGPNRVGPAGNGVVHQLLGVSGHEHPGGVGFQVRRDPIQGLSDPGDEGEGVGRAGGTGRRGLVSRSDPAAGEPPGGDAFLFRAAA